MNRFFRDQRGASMVELTLALPLFMLIAFGTVDASLMLYDWSQANKATYRGARIAVVTAPVATNIINFAYDTDSTDPPMGDLCYDITTGANDVAVGCPTGVAICTSSACTGGFGFNSAAHQQIVEAMQVFFPRLVADNVQVEYRTNGLGFYGRPDGLPMDVTVRIRCMSSQFFFLNALMKWAWPALPDDCDIDEQQNGPPIPAFATTLQSEAMGAS